MIHDWLIRNFKSIGATQYLSFARLNLVAGVNSSGKSALLQSILMASQTLKSPDVDQPLLFNGEFVRLGSLPDVLHKDAVEMELGFTAFATERILPARENMRRGQVRINVNASFGERKSGEDLSPVVLSSVLDVEGSTGASSVEIWRGNHRTLRLGTEPPSALRNEWLNYFVHTSVASQSMSPDSFPSNAERNTIPGLWHFLPQWLFVRQDAEQARLRRLVSYLTSIPYRDPPPTDRDDAVRLAQLLLDEPDLDSLGDLRLRRRRAEIRAKAEGPLKREIRSLLEPFKGDHVWVRRPLPGPAEDAVAHLRQIFTRIYYVGPLRLDPQVLYPMTPTLEDDRVGSKGEFMPAILHRSASRVVDAVLPGDRIPSRVTLQDAVNSWSRYFGILDSFEVQDVGKIGHYPTVSDPQLDRPLDLGSVGVGVSQLLPVIVQCLVAPVGSLIILEQPELHLHPQAESKLGDFLIAVSRSDRQCIVETHSEHLLDRIRLRVAQAEGGGLLEDVRVYFAERRDGVTEFRSIDLNEFGAIADYPEGFFDEGQKASQDILTAALFKRGEPRGRSE